MNEILGAVLKKGTGAGVAGGALQLAFGSNQQMDANKYSIDTKGDDGKKYMATLAFVGGSAVVVLIILAFAFRK